MTTNQWPHPAYDLEALGEIHDTFESVAHDLLRERYRIEDIAEACQTNFRRAISSCVIRAIGTPVVVRVCFSHELQNAVDDYAFHREDWPGCELCIVCPDWLRQGERPSLPFGVELWDAQDLFRAGRLPYTHPGNFDLGVSYVEREIAKALDEELARLLPGEDDASRYEKIVEDILLFVFSPDISLVESQSSDLLRIDRRDSVFRIDGADLFWANLRRSHAKSHMFVVEAKNLSSQPTSKQVKQLEGYLQPLGIGMFGILVTRLPWGDIAFECAVRSRSRPESRTIIALHDHDLSLLLHLRCNRTPFQCQRFLQGKIEELMRAV